MSPHAGQCPKCGSPEVALLIYGLVKETLNLSDPDAAGPDRQPVVYAGCLTPVPTLDRHCLPCEYRWSTRP